MALWICPILWIRVKTVNTQLSLTFFYYYRTIRPIYHTSKKIIFPKKIMIFGSKICSRQPSNLKFWSTDDVFFSKNTPKKIGAYGPLQKITKKIGDCGGPLPTFRKQEPDYPTLLPDYPTCVTARLPDFTARLYYPTARLYYPTTRLYYPTSAIFPTDAFSVERT